MSALEKRVAALEGLRRDDYKPVEPILFGSFAIAIIANEHPRNGRWKAGKESILDAYARACRYRGGTAELCQVAVNAPGTFATKHLNAKPPWTTPDQVEGARREIIERFVVEEWAYRIIDAAEAATGHRLIVHEPLSPGRPLRPTAT
jgi:hypothetical protein